MRRNSLLLKDEVIDLIVLLDSLERANAYTLWKRLNNRRKDLDKGTVYFYLNQLKDLGIVEVEEEREGKRKYLFSLSRNARVYRFDDAVLIVFKKGGKTYYTVRGCPWKECKYRRGDECGFEGIICPVWMELLLKIIRKEFSVPLSVASQVPP